MDIILNENETNATYYDKDNLVHISNDNILHINDVVNTDSLDILINIIKGYYNLRRLEGRILRVIFEHDNQYNINEVVNIIQRQKQLSYTTIYNSIQNLIKLGIIYVFNKHVCLHDDFVNDINFANKDIIVIKFNKRLKQ